MIELAVLCLIGKTNRLALNGYASFTLNIHTVKDLVLEVTLRYNIRGLDKAIGQS